MHQNQARGELKEGAGDGSAYFLKNHDRGDESGLAPLVLTNIESLSGRLRQWLHCKAMCTGTFSLRTPAEVLSGKAMSQMMFNKLYTLTLDNGPLGEKFKAQLVPLAFEDLRGFNRYKTLFPSLTTFEMSVFNEWTACQNDSV